MKNPRAICPDDHDDDLPPLEINFMTETLSYYPPTAPRSAPLSKPQQSNHDIYPPNSSSNNNNSDDGLHIRIKSATTTRGRNIIHGSHDATGVLLWPASHLLCHYLVSLKHNDKTNPHPLGRTVELGCGCGIVGIAAALTMAATTTSPIIVMTDGEEGAIELCRDNIALNIPDDKSTTTTTTIVARCLTWGDESGADDILSLIPTNDSDTNVGLQFDTILAADIVYPATSGLILTYLFQTVQRLLKPDGRFYLSFISRDGCHTPRRLITAASEGGFRIDVVPRETFLGEGEDCQYPMMGAVLLLLRRDDGAVEWNGQLGEENCQIFPGLKAVERRVKEKEDESEEEWEAPFLGDDDEEEEDLIGGV